MAVYLGSNQVSMLGGTILDFYPIGSYYETTDNNFNPNTAWGGTWTSELLPILPKGAAERYGNRVTTALTTTSETTICSFSYISDTGIVHLRGDASISTNKNTSFIRMYVDNALQVTILTNSTTTTRIGGDFIATVTPNVEHTISLRLASQDTSTTATLSAYNTYCLYAEDLPNPNGNTYRWHRTA